jgi:hypothetical protein
VLHPIVQEPGRWEASPPVTGGAGLTPLNWRTERDPVAPWQVAYPVNLSASAEPVRTVRQLSQLAQLPRSEGRLGSVAVGRGEPNSGRNP